MDYISIRIPNEFVSPTRFHVASLLQYIAYTLGATLGFSLSRNNSMFCGSHDGAKRMALIYSLACSCRLNGINTFEYFTDILNRLAYISPNAPDEVFRELLPNRWTKK